jgi:hypothetical protein
LQPINPSDTNAVPNSRGIDFMPFSHIFLFK